MQYHFVAFQIQSIGQSNASKCWRCTGEDSSEAAYWIAAKLVGDRVVDGNCSEGNTNGGRWP